MAGEHPLDRRLREKAQQSKVETEAAERDAVRAAEIAALTAKGWIEDELRLKEAVQGWNKKLSEKFIPRKFHYNPLPQPDGDLARSFVQLADTNSARHAFMDIRVLRTGGILVGTRGRLSEHTYTPGQITHATWDEQLGLLFDQLDG